MRRSYEASSRSWCAQRLDAVTNSLRFARSRVAARAQPRGMTYARQRLGRRAEELVAARLRRAGWRIVARNERLPSGELDIVAMDGGTLVFVEVKAGPAGAGRGPQLPAPALRRREQRKLRRL